MNVSSLKTEYLNNPQGIDIVHPRLSWTIEGDDLIKQTAFEIVYRRNGGEEKVVYQESSSMTYRFEEELKSRDFLTWKVRVQNERGAWSAYSEQQHFSIGLLNKSDWSAKWIYGNYPVSKKQRYPVDCFRKKFVVKDPKEAKLYISALGLYEAKLNGKKVGEGLLTPGSTDPRKRVHYDTYDVSRLLQEGENELTVLLADGWYRGSIGAKGFTYVFGKNTKLLAQLEIKAEGGHLQTIGTDASWDWSNDGPWTFADLKDGEIVDFRKAPSFSDHPLAGSYEHEIRASNNSLVVAIAKEPPVSELLSQTGKRVYKFQNNVAGNLSLRLRGKEGGRIRLVLGERLDEKGDVTLENIQCIRKGKRSPLQEVTIICRDGINEYETKFFYGGFQYAGVEECEGVEVEEINQIAISTQMDETSSFECSSALINTFYENTIRSCRSNFVDIPTDCPTRERMGWTGDSQIIFNTASYLFDCRAFFRKHVEDVFDRQDKNGRLPQIAPYSAEDWFMNVMNGSVGWADAGVLIPYRMYEKYGDLSILREHYDDMVRYAKFMIKRCGPAKGFYALYAKPLHLSKKNKRFGVNSGQSYGEWAEPKDVKSFVWTDFATPHPEESMAYTSYILGLMIQISNLLGKCEDIALFQEYQEGVKRAYQELVGKPEHTLDTDRQCKQVRPLAFGLLTAEQEAFAKKRLIEALDHYGWRLGTGFLSTPFILFVLEEIDPRCAYRLLLNEQMPGWLYMAKENTGTIWEGWEGPNSEGGIASLNHYSKGAMVEWLFASMLGIRPSGENRFCIQPIVDSSITFAKGSYRSIFGEVSVSWETKEGRVSFDVLIPPNCEAEFKYRDIKKTLGPGRHSAVL